MINGTAKCGKSYINHYAIFQQCQFSRSADLSWKLPSCLQAVSLIRQHQAMANYGWDETDWRWGYTQENLAVQVSRYLKFKHCQ